MGTSNLGIDTISPSELAVGDWQNNFRQSVNDGFVRLDSSVGTIGLGLTTGSAGWVLTSNCWSAIYTATSTDTFIDSVGTWTIGLPASPATGRHISIYSTNATITINGNANLISGSATATIIPAQTKTFVKRTTGDWIAY